jgi:hypothetical protein
MRGRAVRVGKIAMVGITLVTVAACSGGQTGSAAVPTVAPTATIPPSSAAGTVDVNRRG